MYITKRKTLKFGSFFVPTFKKAKVIKPFAEPVMIAVIYTDFH